MTKLSKLLLSFFKSDWQLADYPLSVQNLSDLPLAKRGLGVDFPVELGPLLQWKAEIIGWKRLSAFGNTSEEAIANLECKFYTYKSSSEPLPRPGTQVPQEQHDRTEIEAYEIIAVDFFGSILKTNFYTCVLSDEASLWDFLPGEDYNQRISTRYGIDISSISNGNLVKIFRMIYDRYKNP
jgi:hypothetical protein